MITEQSEIRRMHKSNIETMIQELASEGMIGHERDFRSWIDCIYHQKYESTQVQAAIDSLVDRSILKASFKGSGEYEIATPPIFENHDSYSVSNSLNHSPLQMVRSRLESFLKFHKVAPDEIIDLSIATTEAMENAIKYSGENEILVSYSLKESQFFIEIINSVKVVTPEEDILAGKYTSETTLMRGMMVMMKLFDHMDINIHDESGKATLHGSRRVAIQ